ncbi:MAG: ComF family protein [Acidobacteriia bacterium]|nr:ComF family protein [Terriglobia bacterium]
MNHPRRGKLPGWLAELCDGFAAVLFPAPCRLCGELLARAALLPLCDACLESFLPLPAKVCEVCGLPLEALAAAEGESLLCSACREDFFNFERARSYAVYDGALVRAVILLKYQQLAPLGKWFAARLAEVAGRNGEFLAADVVVPVPLHRERQRQRGYNQAELIAGPLARHLRLPCRSVLLVRTRPRPDKLHLTLEERWSSVRGAFAARPGSQVDNRRVLLVDDVMTTGATLDACAKALLDAGAKSVVCLTVARATSHTQPPRIAEVAR